MFNDLNAAPYKNSDFFYTSEFEKLLGIIVFCYNKMINDNVILKNNEEKIRDILHHNYLNNNDFRHKIGLLDFSFERESLEDYSLDRTDIKIKTLSSFEDTDAYYVIECKRLDNTNLKGNFGLNAKYIREGINRFITKKYSCYYRINGMIGFVVQKIDINANIDNINTLLNETFTEITTLKILQKTDIIQHFDYQYISEHKDIDKNELKLYHLMFDFSNNMEPNK